MCEPTSPRLPLNIRTISFDFANSTFAEGQNSVKLPISDLPQFNGDYEEWISFKNEFGSLIGSHTDIDDVDKFIYLRSSLVEPVKKKLAVLDATTENYKVVWDTLTNLHERRRFII